MSETITVFQDYMFTRQFIDTFNNLMIIEQLINRWLSALVSVCVSMSCVGMYDCTVVYIVQHNNVQHL